jgi:aerobic-type carbon monoxide dehydrogenase small subunit (CoxS/CutS family)
MDIKVNGKTWPVEASADTPLLYVLTNELRLKGPRFGCGLAQCGSCSVLADGVEIRSCVTPVSAVANKAVTTFEGLAALYAQQKGLTQAPALHPLQQAFIDEQAPHCGYCYNGMLIKGSELLAQNPRPTEAEIRAHMNGHLCRCGTYPRVMAAIQLASANMAGGAK